MIRITSVEIAGRTGLLVRAYGGGDLYFLPLPEEADRQRAFKLARSLCEASPIEFSDLIVEHLDRGLGRAWFRMTRAMVGVLLACARDTFPPVMPPSSTRT
jgi:hypothetical protein